MINYIKKLYKNIILLFCCIIIFCLTTACTHKRISPHNLSCTTSLKSKAKKNQQDIWRLLYNYNKVTSNQTITINNDKFKVKYYSGLIYPKIIKNRETVCNLNDILMQENIKSLTINSNFLAIATLTNNKHNKILLTQLPCSLKKTKVIFSKEIVYQIKWLKNFLIILVKNKNSIPNKLYYINTANNNLKIQHIYTEKENNYFLSIEENKDKNYLIIKSWNGIYSKYFALQFNKKQPNIIFPYKNIFLSSLSIVNNQFFGAKENYILYKAPGQKTREIFHSHNIITQIIAYPNHLFIFIRNGIKQKIGILNLLNLNTKYISLPKNCYPTPTLDLSLDWSLFKFTCNYLNAPKKILIYDITKKKVFTPKNNLIPAKKYSAKTTFADIDNQKIPITIFSSNNNPKGLVLRVYGAYGFLLKPTFDPLFALLLNKGYHVGFIHIRGGGFYGKKWQIAGNEINFKNRGRDILTALKFIYKNKIYTPSSTFIIGKSAAAMPIAYLISNNHLSTKIISGVIFEYPYIKDLNKNKKNTTILEDIQWQNIKSPIKILQQRIQPLISPPILTITSKKDSIAPYKLFLKWLYLLRLKNQNMFDCLYISKTASHLGEKEISKKVNNLLLELGFIVNNTH